jgi:hypothetical protein
MFRKLFFKRKNQSTASKKDSRAKLERNIIKTLFFDIVDEEDEEDEEENENSLNNNEDALLSLNDDLTSLTESLSKDKKNIFL